MDLANKRILITGASDSIGKVLAIQLAKLGTHLVLLGRNTEKLGTTKVEAEKAGAGSVSTFAFDLADSQALVTNCERIVNEHPDTAVVVNNAGVWVKRDQLDTVSLEQIEETMMVNLTAQIKLTRLLLPNLRKQTEAAIINVSSRSGVLAQAGQAVYSASKWGMKGFTDVLAEDLKETNIKVAGVYQGKTATQIHAKAGEVLPLGNAIDPTALADVIVFMLSQPKNCWLNEVRVTN
jgi:short-subunit dehydrogenase